MKRNAIVRILLYSMMILILVGILLVGIGFGSYAFRIGSGDGTVVETEGAVQADSVRHLEIDWAAGSIQIVTADTDSIIFREVAKDNAKYQMTYKLSGDTLELDYGYTWNIGFGSMPEKDLIITVPTSWTCGTLEIDAAAVSIRMDGIAVDELDMDGAANKLNFRGAVGRVNVDGAANEITLFCTEKPKQIDMDGASCELALTLPADCGFQVETEGLSCNFSSTLNYSHKNGVYLYGDGYCKVSADGISCSIKISEATG